MTIEIKGAYENNLKHVDLVLPKQKLIAFTGVSGSGKSTMAMDTLQRECQRQLMESLGMTLNMGEKAKVKSMTGLSPAISIHQSQTTNNPRSTVGTVTEISSYLRVLFAKWCSTETDSLTPDHFSYNKPQGACEGCHGLGVQNAVNIHLLVDHSKSVLDSAISGWDQAYIQRYGAAMVQAGKHYGFHMPIDIPVGEYNTVQRDLLLYGVLSEAFQRHFKGVSAPKTVPEGRFEGVVTNFMRRYSESASESASQKFEKFFEQQPCPQCNGKRYSEQALKWRVHGKNILQAQSLSISELYKWVSEVKAMGDASEFEDFYDDILHRARRLIDIGASYLTLSQPSSSLSAGEWQRIKLAGILGSALTGVLYILDEPTSGLHPRDHHKIISALKQLRDIGNTVIVIEHNHSVIAASDHIVVFGPGAGKHGGTIVAEGSASEVLTRPVYKRMRPVLEKSHEHFTVKDASLNHLKNITLDVPLKRLVCVTGVSGSGKTSLVMGCIAKMRLDRKIVVIDQQTIGRSSRSNSATYVDLFTDIRQLFASLSETKAKGLSAKHFSYNTPGGRCEACQGSGKKVVSMYFLPDIETTCPECGGKRYHSEVLDVLYRGHSISDVLELGIDEALELFREERKINEKLAVLQAVGLGYISLGQSTATLSGGEAQRLKLAKELMASKGSDALYLLDEPLTGLHHDDCKKLITILSRLVDQGNSVIAIEHRPELIIESDWIIDLGPEGGADGGYVVFEGTVEALLGCETSHTGRAIK